MGKVMKNIQQRISQACLYDQLAEEAAELAHAAMKMARKLRAENPTPMTVADITAYVKEEYSDVVLCARILDILPDEDLIEFKQQRWDSRLVAKIT